MVYLYVGVPLVLLLLAWLLLELRRRRLYTRLARSAEEQANWGL